LRIDEKEKQMTNIHPAFKEGNVAVITGAASGIGLAAAKKFASYGMSVVLADLEGDNLAKAFDEVVQIAAEGEAQVVSIATDVAKQDTLESLERATIQRFGRVHVLMNNAGIQPGSSIFGSQANWENIFNVNLKGVILGTRIFGENMIAHGEPGLIINTGSKQGITTPPGDPAYNVAKAGVKAFTEALQHELRNTQNCNISAHLLIPGFVFTALTANGRTEKPAGAWTAEQTIDFMSDRLAAGDFYILCPDGEVDRQTDEKRILWAASDIVENRPPLSRWHPNYSEKFKTFLKT
jgi:NAD(P)-dependent dehydrogenase (short-subunit alcohol dehydrogenase family)